MLNSTTFAVLLISYNIQVNARCSMLGHVHILRLTIYKHKKGKRSYLKFHNGSSKRESLTQYAQHFILKMSAHSRRMTIILHVGFAAIETCIIYHDPIHFDLKN